MTLAPRTSRILAVGLLVVTAVLGYVSIVEPLTNLYSSQQDRISMLASRAARIVTRPEDVSALKSRLTRLQAQAGSVTPFWPGATDAVAAAGLQERVKALLQQEGATIDNVEVMPPVVDGSVHKIALKVRFQAEIDQVERVVHAVETMSPSLMVDRLTIRNSDTLQSSAPPLSIELQVFGLAMATARERPSS